jgi:hypothetical protein
MITSSGDSSASAVSVQSNWPLATNLSPLLVEGVEHALRAGRAVVIGGPPHNSNDRSKMMSTDYLGFGIEEVTVITSACDWMAGERAAEVTQVGDRIYALQLSLPIFADYRSESSGLPQSMSWRTVAPVCMPANFGATLMARSGVDQWFCS